MPYTIENAMQDEIQLLREMEKVENNVGRTIVSAIFREQANSLQRCLNRLNGYDYSLKIVDGEIKRVHVKSNRKTLEEEYPALKKAAEDHNLLRTMLAAEPE